MRRIEKIESVTKKLIIAKEFVKEKRSQDMKEMEEIAKDEASWGFKVI